MIARRVRRAAGALWLAHGCTAVVSLAAAWPLTQRVAAPRPAPDRATVSALIVALRLLDDARLQAPHYATLPALVSLTLAPLLLLVWLRATELRDDLPSHAQAVASRYGSALCIHLGKLGCGALALLLSMAAGVATEHILSPGCDARLRALAAASIALPPLAAWVYALTLADLLTAQLALESGGGRAGLAGAVRSARPGLVFARGGFALASLLLTAAGVLLPRWWFGLGTGATLAVTASTQLLALLASLLRGTWLAWMLERRRA